MSKDSLIEFKEIAPLLETLRVQLNSSFSGPAMSRNHQNDSNLNHFPSQERKMENRNNFKNYFPKPWEVPHSERLKNLMETGFESDATICVGPEKVLLKVHRLILIMGSPSFALLFGASINNHLVFEEIKPEVFKLLLNYLYIGKSGVGRKDTLDLIQLAIRFEIVDLMQQCFDSLEDDSSEENILAIYKHAVKDRNNVLINSALKYICGRGWIIVEMEEFLRLPVECLIEIAKQDDLSVSNEMQLFKAILRWGNASCSRQGINPLHQGSLRKVLEPVIHFLRFPLMEQGDFAANVASKNILTSDELVPLLIRFALPIESKSGIPLLGFSSTPRKYFYPSRNPAPASPFNSR